MFCTQYGNPKDWAKNPELKKVAKDFLGMAETYVNTVGVKDPANEENKNTEQPKD